MTCPRCKGQKMIRPLAEIGCGEYPRVECAECAGTGEVPNVAPEDDEEKRELRAMVDAFKKPIFELDEEAALRNVIARLTARARDLGDDALLLGYLIGAAIKNYRQGHP